MSNPGVIEDPFFYAVAVFAVLLVGISKSGFGAGFGSLAVPLMALAVPVPQAAAILMPLLLVMDLMGLRAFRGRFDWSLLRFLLPFGLLGSLIGFLLFKLLDPRALAGIVGRRGHGLQRWAAFGIEDRAVRLTHLETVFAREPNAGEAEMLAALAIDLPSTAGAGTAGRAKLVIAAELARRCRDDIDGVDVAA